MSLKAKIFVRSIFPIQNKINEEWIKAGITEAKKGEYLTNVCRVSVIQEGGHTKGIDSTPSHEGTKATKRKLQGNTRN